MRNKRQHVFTLLNYCDKVSIIFENETRIVNVGSKTTFKSFFAKMIILNTHFISDNHVETLCHSPSFDRPQWVTQHAVGACEEIIMIKTFI